MARAKGKGAQKRVRQPKQARSRETRRILLVAAAQLFAHQGYAGTTTNAVARRAGVAIGTVYEYFRDKDALLRALVEEHLAQAEALLMDRVRGLVDRGRPASLEVLVRELVRATVDLHTLDPALHAVLTAEALRSSVLRAQVVALEERVSQRVSTLLRARAPMLPNPDLTARIVVAAVDALAHRWIVDTPSGALTEEQLIDELTRLVLAYLRASRRAR